MSIQLFFPEAAKLLEMNTSPDACTRELKTDGPYSLWSNAGEAAVESPTISTAFATVRAPVSIRHAESPVPVS